MIPHEPHRWASPDAIADTLLVKPRGDVVSLRPHFSGAGAEHGAKIGSQGAHIIRAYGDKSEALAADLLKAGLVEYAQPDVNHYAAAIPTDTFWSDSLDDFQHMWDLQKGGSVSVAVLDSGCNQFADFGANVLSGWNVLNNSTSVPDTLNHGTDSCSVIAADTNNGSTGGGVAGLGWGIKVVPVKCNSIGQQANSNTVLGIDWVVTNSSSTKIISIGYAGPTASTQALQDEITVAWNAGLIICVAAGDTNDTVTQYPAALTNAVAVCECRIADRENFGGSFGPWTDTAGHIGIAAAGQHFAYDRNGARDAFGGSSVSCPAFSAALAMAWSYAPSKTNTQLLAAAVANGDPCGSSFGTPPHPATALNAYRFINALRSDTPRGFSLATGGF